MNSEVTASSHRPMKRLSTMFASLQDKFSSQREEREPAPGPGTPSAQDQTHPADQFFFEYLVVVSLHRSKQDGSYKPVIMYQFPKLPPDLGRSQREEEEKSREAITLFCFPEGVDWAPLTEYHSETFSFVLTEVDGSRRNGYCRRLLPHGKGARPPEAYCIISKVACFGLFSKIFDEVEKRRQKSMAMIYPFMQSLREAAFPAPGDTVEIKSFIPESGTEIISLTRPCDSWLEHVDFKTLFSCLSDQEVLKVFSSTVMERRLIFIADELSTLSQVLHGVVALLYPFTWQHTFISIVPRVLIDVVMAPTPFLLGVQRTMLEHIHDQSDMLIVDLSAKAENRFITSIGDEDSILPEKMQEDLLEALSSRNPNLTSQELSGVVSEAFLSFFVRTVGHFSAHVKHGSAAHPGAFQRKSFCKAVEHRANRSFVKSFSKTQMFDIFIQEVERQPATQEGRFVLISDEANHGGVTNTLYYVVASMPDSPGFFHKKVAEYQEKKTKEKAKSGWMRGLM